MSGCECEAGWVICDKCKNPPPGIDGLLKESLRLDREDYLEKRVKDLEALCREAGDHADALYTTRDNMQFSDVLIARLRAAGRGEAIE